MTSIIDNLIKSFGYDVKLLWKSLKIFIYMWGRVGPSGHPAISLEESAFALCGFVDFFDAASTIAIIGPFPTLKLRLKSKDKKKKKKKIVKIQFCTHIFLIWFVGGGGQIFIQPLCPQ